MDRWKGVWDVFEHFTPRRSVFFMMSEGTTAMKSSVL
jgi:hypothetical protein